MIAGVMLEAVRARMRVWPQLAVRECQAAVQSVSTQSDEALLEAHLAGDEGAFTTLVSRYARELVPYLARVTGSRATADDVFQEAFLQVHQSAHTFDLSRRFKPWLYTIAVNKARDWHRRQSRRRALSLSTPIGSDGDGFGIIDLIEGDSVVPTEGLERAELASRVRDAIDSMPHHLREIILLSYFQKMSYNQISETLQVPLGTVKSRLHAAVASFAQSWAQSGNDEQGALA
jgi:RNA polymerase sigma-70 factor (ECF subfamily)